jgi:(2Fe-2S) ferredoxin
MEKNQNMYDIHLFVCTNQRELPKTGCGDLGSMDLLATLKKEISQRNLQNRIRINKAGCLSMCEKGPAMVLYPHGKWFFNVKPEDLSEILNEISKPKI